MPSSRFISPIRPIAAAMLSLVAAWAQAAPLAIDLPAQPLSTSIQQLSRQSGLSIGGNAALLEGKAAPAVHGTLEPVDALRQLLQGSGLRADLDGNKAVIRKAASVLKEVVVHASNMTPDQNLQRDGRGSEGYRADLVSRAGFLDQTKIQDLPYSYSVASSDLIENAGTESAEKILSMMPSLQTNGEERGGNGGRYVLSRGFSQNWAVDGMVRAFSNITGSIPLEDKERIEQLSGLSGFLSGAALNIGGVTNYVLKRPTDKRLAKVTAGAPGGTSRYLHGDFGGPLGDRFGYRINIAGRDGDTSIKNQSIRSDLVSVAFDFKPIDSTVFQADYAHYDYKINAPNSSWSLRGAVIPDAPDLSETGAPEWTYSKWTTDRAGIRFRSAINDHLAVRGGFQHEQNINNYVYFGHGNIAANGSYSGTLGNSNSDSRFYNTTGHALADLNFETSGIKHAITTGYSRQKMWAKFNSPTNSYWSTINGFNYYDPAASAAALQTAYNTLASQPPIGGPYVTSYSYVYESIPIADRIDITDQWSIILGASYDRMGFTNYDATTGAETQNYRESRLSPSGSIIFRPVPSVSTYFTYQEGLTPGDVVPSTYFDLPVTNPGASSPNVHKGYELGVKWAIGKAMVTLAAFDMTQANTYYMMNSAGTSYTHYGNGRQKHKGIDIGISGKVTENLTVFGGAMSMDAKITDRPNNPGVAGQMPAGVSKYMQKLYAEYDVTRIPGLTLTAGVQNYSRFVASNVTTGLKYIPGYTYGSIGARYKTVLGGYDTTFRFNLDNVTNERYWYPRGSGASPLTAMFSATVNLN
jgi:iron complex outermembrane receptor protein